MTNFLIVARRKDLAGAYFDAYDTNYERPNTFRLDDDALEQVRRESRSRGVSFRHTPNDLLRTALNLKNRPLQRALKIMPIHMGYRTGLNYDDVESLLEYEEGAEHR